MKKILQLLTLVMIVIVAVACGKKDDVTSIKISGETKVEVGSEITLTVEVKPTDAKVKWSSSDNKIATVNNGVVTGVSEGTVKITAEAGNMKDEHEITVVEKLGVDPNETVRTQEDTRKEAYILYSADGEEIDRFRSLYIAIEYTVNNEDYGAYITKAEGEDTHVKLFTFNERFSSDSEDMFFYYKKGNQLDTYTSWKDTYWQELKEAEDAIAVSISPATGTSVYFNSHQLVAVSTYEEGADTTQYWNVSQNIEASSTVNM